MKDVLVHKQYGAYLKNEDNMVPGNVQSRNTDDVVVFTYDGNEPLFLETIYGIPFDANGGTGAPESITVREGETITIPETAPSRAGYTFLGWASQPDAVSEEYRPGDRVTITESLTFYAVWENNSSEEDPEEAYLFGLLSGSDSAVTIMLENNTGMRLQAMAVVAVYDREGRMIACETTEEGAAIESWQTLTVTFSESDGADQVLAFLMDTDTGRPRCPVWRRPI